MPVPGLLPSGGFGNLSAPALYRDWDPDILTPRTPNCIALCVVPVWRFPFNSGLLLAELSRATARFRTHSPAGQSSSGMTGLPSGMSLNGAGSKHRRSSGRLLAPVESLTLRLKQDFPRTG